MFDRAVIRAGGNDAWGVTIGRIAEALLYYRKVHLVLSDQAISYLVSQIGAARLIDLLKRDEVDVTLVGDMPATATNAVGPLSAHKFTFMSFTPYSQDNPRPKMGKGAGFLKRERMETTAKLLARAGASKDEVSRLTRLLYDRATSKALSEKHFSETPIGDLALRDIKDDAFRHAALRMYLEGLLPADVLPSEFVTRVYESDLGFYIFGNLDFAGLEAARLKLGLGEVQITEAAALNAIFEARVDLSLAAHYQGDFYSSTLGSRLIRLRYDDWANRAEKNRESINSFEEIVLEGMPSVAEVIDSGDRNFDDFLKLLDKAGQFRNWAAGLNPDANIVAAYLREVGGQHWLQIGAGKVLRYALGLIAGADAFGVAGQVVNAVDALVLDDVLQRWRASHFVDNRLRPFVKPRLNLG